MTSKPITLRPVSVVRLLAVSIGCLALANVAVLAVKHAAGYGTAYGLVPLFDMNGETNLPSFYSAAQLLLASLLLASIATSRKDAWTRHWAALSGAFLVMAFDEGASIHELLGRPSQELLGDWGAGLSYSVWVVPGILIALVFAGWFLKFFLHLPGKTRIQVAIAAVLFLGGAMGLEVVQARYAQLHGEENPTFSAFVLIEESLEMAGIALFIYALLRYMEENCEEVRIRVGDP